jgi:hypothetical protein
VVNQGDANAGPSSTRLSLSPTSANTEYGVQFLLDYVSSNSLNKGQSSTVVYNVPVPANIPADVYYVTAYVDAFRRIEEKEDLGLVLLNNIESTSNSSGPKTLTISEPRFPDLVVQSVTGPDKARVGNSITVSVNITNSGDDSAEASLTRVFLGTAGEPTQIYLGDYQLSSLNIGQSSINSVTVVIPSFVAVGNYNISAMSDVLRRIEEQNEDNNLRTGTTLISISDVASECRSLAINNSAGGSITLNPSPDCPGDASKYKSSTSVELTANPASGFAFDRWDNDCAGQGQKCTLVMSADRSATAFFSEIQSCPSTLALSNTSLSSSEVFAASSAISAGPNFTVESGAVVTFRASTEIRLNPGFTARSGSEFKAEIVPNPC